MQVSTILQRLWHWTPNAPTPNPIRHIEGLNSKPETTASDLQHLTVNQYLRDQLAMANVEIAQLKFLLASAPMIDMLDYRSPDTQRRMRAFTTPFAYIHPKTLAPFTTNMPPGRVYVFPGSQTVWVPMSTMPEGRVIFSPLPVPGLEKVLVG